MYRFGKMEHDAMEYLPLLIEKMSIDPAIIAIFLFGSYARGRPTPVSDIDLAVLLDQYFSPRQCFEKKLQLLALATKVLKTDEVDLVVLNQAPPALGYRILNSGQMLWEQEKNKNQRVQFQARTYQRYFDFQPVEKIMRDGLAKRIKGGQFGG